MIKLKDPKTFYKCYQYILRKNKWWMYKSIYLERTLAAYELIKIFEQYDYRLMFMSNIIEIECREGIEMLIGLNATVQCNMAFNNNQAVVVLFAPEGRVTKSYEESGLDKIIYEISELFRLKVYQASSM